MTPWPSYATGPAVDGIDAPQLHLEPYAASTSPMAAARIWLRLEPDDECGDAAGRDRACGEEAARGGLTLRLPRHASHPVEIQLALGAPKTGRGRTPAVYATIAASG